MNSELQKIAAKLGVSISLTLPAPDERPNDLDGFLTSYEEDLDITTTDPELKEAEQEGEEDV